MQAIFDRIVAYLKKIESFLVDRRAWALAVVAGVLMLSGFFGLDQELQDMLNLLFGELFDTSVALVAAVTALIIVLGKIVALVWPLVQLLKSWTDRPPSGVEAFLPRRAGAGRPS
jgi:protein-S-isoprenylcysteine O-methyltransferase Ste14